MPLSFAQIPDPLPPTELLPRILTRVEELQLRRWYIRLAALLTVTGTMATYLVLRWTIISQELQASSFLQLLRVAFSDPDVVFANTTDFMLGLLESLPVAPVFFALLGVFLVLSLAQVFSRVQDQRRSQSFSFLS